MQSLLTVPSDAGAPICMFPSMLTPCSRCTAVTFCVLLTLRRQTELFESISLRRHKLPDFVWTIIRGLFKDLGNLPRSVARLTLRRLRTQQRITSTYADQCSECTVLTLNIMATFNNLPTEIRDLIYEFLFTTLKLVYKPPGAHHTPLDRPH